MNRAIVAIVCFTLSVAALAQAGPTQREQQLLDLVNHEREKAGLQKLEWNDRLAEAALAHSRLLEKNQDLSHQFPGEPPLQERVGATNLRFNSVAENVAEAPEVEVAHTALMHSPGHRENILHKDYNAIGIAIVAHGQQLFVTQDFAHILASYTEKQVGDDVIARFNQGRRAKRLPAVDAVTDPRLKKAACAHDMNTSQMIQGLHGATGMMVFSISSPGALPDELRQMVADRATQRMSVGVCMQTGGKNGFSKFWVVTAFFQ
jgi:uncharacterized protein YkwD